MARLVFIIYILFLMALQVKAEDISTVSQPEADSLQTVIIEVNPETIYVAIDDSTGRFVERRIKILNRGRDTLRIKDVKTSCFCAGYTVLNGKIEYNETGEIYVFVNLEGVSRENNIIEFLIESNACNSPSSVKFIFEY